MSLEQSLILSSSRVFACMQSPYEVGAILKMDKEKMRETKYFKTPTKIKWQ